MLAKCLLTSWAEQKCPPVTWLPPATDDSQARRELYGRLPNVREDAEAALWWTYVVPARVLAAAASGVTAGAESATSVSGDDVEVRDTWRHGLRSTFAGV